jgi:hypothetical protein
VLHAVNLIAEACQMITPTTIKNCFLEFGFRIENVISSGNSAVKLTENEWYDWHSYSPLECSLRIT